MKLLIILIAVIIVILSIIPLSIYAKEKDDKLPNLVIDVKDKKNTKDTEKLNAFKSARSAMPNIDRIYNPKNNSYKYITYYKDRYALDFEKSWFGFDSDEIFNSNANVMFSIQQSLVETMIFLIDKVYNFKVYSLVSGLVKKIIKNMYDSNSNFLISIVLAMLGFYFAYKMILNQQSEFWSTLIKIAAILTFSLLFFNKPNLIIEKIDYVMTNISNDMLELKPNLASQESEVKAKTEQTKEGKNTGSTQIANAMWEQYILKPWQFLEFGNTELANEYTDEILEMSPNGEKRTERLNEIFEIEEVDTHTLATDRLSFVCMYFIPLIANIAMISLMCVLIIGYQFLAIILFIIGALVVILALLPNGTNILKAWASKVIGFASMKVLLTFLFTILLSVNEILFNSVNSEGWIAVLSILFINRNSIISMFGSLQKELSNPYLALHRMKRIKDFPFMYNYSNGQSGHNYSQHKQPDNINHYNYKIYQGYSKNKKTNNLKSFDNNKGSNNSSKTSSTRNSNSANNINNANSGNRIKKSTAIKPKNNNQNGSNYDIKEHIQNLKSKQKRFVARPIRGAYNNKLYKKRRLDANESKEN